MQNIEPFYNWRDHYIASEDENSPFFGREYSEFMYSHTIYNYYIHPQWDEIGSPTLFIKILFADYHNEFAIIELIGEWNDCINNDIMYLKRNIIDPLLKKGINKFILLGENVLNFHCSDDSYYEEWYEDTCEEGGWIVAVNFREHVLQEMNTIRLNHYLLNSTRFSNINWRTYQPLHLLKLIDDKIYKALQE